MRFKELVEVIHGCYNEEPPMIVLMFSNSNQTELVSHVANVADGTYYRDNEVDFYEFKIRNGKIFVEVYLECRNENIR